MIELRFRKKFGKFQLSVDFSTDGFIEFTGQNGSGKTTLLRCISGYLPLDAGYVRIDGKDLTNLSIAQRKTVYISHDSFLPSLSVTEHLSWPLGKQADGEQVERLRERLAIDYNGRLSDLSLGQKLRVSIATAIVSRPVALLLDEVLQNISEREKFINELGQICRENQITILSASQENSGHALFENHYSLETGFLKRTR